MNGDIIRLGGKHLDPGGYDLLGVLTGSEGLFGCNYGSNCSHPPQTGDCTRRAVGLF